MVDDVHKAKIERRMARIDALPADVRAVVHDEGMTIVNAFLACGVRKAKHMRHLIDTVRAGGRFSNGGENRMQVRARLLSEGGWNCPNCDWVHGPQRERCHCGEPRT